MSKWFKRRGSKECSTILLCFPYAGGTAQIYDAWHAHFALLDIEVIAVQYPGRMERMNEPCIDNAQELISCVIQELKQEKILSRRTILYGHSNGAIAAFEFAKQLEQQDEQLVTHLFLAARNVPTDKVKLRSKMSDEDLKVELKALNGTPDELLNNKEFMDIISPSIRADFAIGEDYRIESGTKLQSSASFIYGTEENITQEDIGDWQQFFQEELSVFLLPAEHLFVNTHRQQLLSILTQVITPYIGLKLKDSSDVY